VTDSAANEIDWAALRTAAGRAGRHAYAPYSGLRVGAAALTESGDVVVGCNVENASLGLTLCSECALVGATRASGAETLVAVSCCSPDTDEILQPCGRCRQILFEMGGHDLLVDGPGEVGQHLAPRHGAASRRCGTRPRSAPGC
jgi:cytidine deaminase